MGVEIERKYLIHKDLWHSIDKGKGEYLRQGYISTDPSKTIRVRVTDSKGFLTIKGSTKGISRLEFEYEIPREEAIELLNHFTSSSIEKIRYKISHIGKVWEADEFKGENEGLLLAEIELSSATETFEIPRWIGKEV